MTKKYTHVTYGTAQTFESEEAMHKHITGHPPAWWWRDRIP